MGASESAHAVEGRAVELQRDAARNATLSSPLPKSRARSASQVRASEPMHSEQHIAAEAFAAAISAGKTTAEAKTEFAAGIWNAKFFSAFRATGDYSPSAPTTAALMASYERRLAKRPGMEFAPPPPPLPVQHTETRSTTRPRRNAHASQLAAATAATAYAPAAAVVAPAVAAPALTTAAAPVAMETDRKASASALSKARLESEMRRAQQKASTVPLTRAMVEYIGSQTESMKQLTSAEMKAYLDLMRRVHPGDVKSLGRNPSDRRPLLLAWFEKHHETFDGRSVGGGGGGGGGAAEI
jgi:hypothetical protein